MFHTQVPGRQGISVLLTYKSQEPRKKPGEEYIINICLIN